MFTKKEARKAVRDARKAIRDRLEELEELIQIERKNIVTLNDLESELDKTGTLGAERYEEIVSKADDIEEGEIERSF